MGSNKTPRHRRRPRGNAFLDHNEPRARFSSPGLSGLRAFVSFHRAVADEALLTTPGKGAREGTLLSGPLDVALPKLKSLPKLGSVATIQSGPVPEPPVAERGARTPV